MTRTKQNRLPDLTRFQLLPEEQDESDEEEATTETTQDEYPYGWDDLERGEELILDGQQGAYLVVKVERDTAGTYRAVKLVGPDDETTYRLKSGPHASDPFLLEHEEERSPVQFMAAVDSTSVDDGGTVSVAEYDRIGKNERRLRTWIREEYHDG